MRTIFVGDVHGCLKEGEELIRLLEYKPGRDRLIFLGDLVDRGPEPAEVVRWVHIGLRAECILGNHEDKMLSFLAKEARERNGGAPNKMRRPTPQRLKEWTSIPEDDLAWLRSLPYSVQVDNWMAVHAGFEPRVELADQRTDRIIRIRHVKKETGEYAGLKETDVPYNADGTVKVPDGCADWQHMYDLPFNVVYGHAVHAFKQVRWDHLHRPDGQKVTLSGIDTGCCFGGSLTALVLEDASYQVVSVPAARRYAELPAMPTE